jgi:hypothetical protein
MAGTMFGMGVSPAYPIAANPGLTPFGSYGSQSLSQLTWQQILQLVQIVPQQLQQIQALQQQQLLYVQQLLQLVPTQLQQLQQLIQNLPLQASSAQAFGPSLAAPLGFGLLPQAFPGQVSTHVM